MSQDERLAEASSLKFDRHLHDEYFDEARGDEQRSALNLPSDLQAAKVDLAASIDRLTETGLRIKHQRDNMLEILRDLVRAADMVAPVFSGAALGYIMEVKRVAQLGIEAGRS